MDKTEEILEILGDLTEVQTVTNDTIQQLLVGLTKMTEAVALLNDRVFDLERKK